MSWTYAVMKETKIDPHELWCTCGHKGEDHHAVYWPLGVALDECEAYGSNEDGGQKPTWRARLFNTRWLQPGWPTYARDEQGKAILPGVWPKRRLRHFVRHFVRGPLWVDHCHKFKEVT